MKSLLYQDGATPFVLPPGCGICDRVEVPITLRKAGRLYHFVLRDKVGVDDILVIMVKAAAFAIQQGEPYAGTPPARSVKDFVIKTETVI